MTECLTAGDIPNVDGLEWPGDPTLPAGREIQWQETEKREVHRDPACFMDGFVLAVPLGQIGPMGTRADHQRTAFTNNRLSVPVRPGSEALPAINGPIRTHCFRKLVAFGGHRKLQISKSGNL